MDNREIGTRIRLARRDAGLTQEKLAEKIGVNRLRTCPGVRLTGPQHRKVKGVPFSLQAQNGQGRQEDDGRRSEQDQPQSTAGGPARYGGRPLTGGG